MAGFSQAPEETAPVLGVPCVPTEHPVPGHLPLPLLLAATCQLQSVRSEDKDLKISIRSSKGLNIPVSDSIFLVEIDKDFSNW